LGGGERYPVELARALARYADVELGTLGSRPRVVRERSGPRVRTLRPIGHGHRHGHGHGHPAHPLAPQLPWALDGADLVHTHNTRSAPSRVAAVAARFRVFDRFLTVSLFSATLLGVPADRTRARRR
jgi:hypothetical protein